MLFSRRRQHRLLPTAAYLSNIALTTSFAETGNSDYWKPRFRNIGRPMPARRHSQAHQATSLFTSAKLPGLVLASLRYALFHTASESDHPTLILYLSATARVK